ncbi:MAG: GNAT family N-acetyltransferase [Acidimicrobiales bacterium]
MGRLLGDGGWYFHVLDMAVLPEHQRRGLGNTILGALLGKIRDHVPAGCPWRCARRQRSDQSCAGGPLRAPHVQPLPLWRAGLERRLPSPRRR